MLRHLVVLFAVKIGEISVLLGHLGLFFGSRSGLGHISHLDSLLLLSIDKHISVNFFGLQQRANLWLLLFEPLFVTVHASILRLEILVLYITIIISVLITSAALAFLPRRWIDAVSDVDHSVV